MYYFIAHYTDLNTDKPIEKNIEFDGQFLDSERECYLYAMGKAYDMMKENEIFDILESMAC